MSDDHEGAEAAEGVRLQKVLAAAGLGSRRACEELIDAGRVEVDGKIVREQGVRVDPESAVIKVDGSRLPTRTGMTYLVLNKPRGVVSTMSDPENRPCIGDYVRDRTERLFHVGRLDTDTEGLILFTNDGDLANRLTHPKYGVPKTYFADIPGPIPRDLGRTMKAGVELEDGLAKADKFRMIGQAGGRVQVEVEIHEGRNHIVRRMFDAVGHPVARLVRVQIGSVNMGNLAPGRLRHLTTHEVSALLTASEEPTPAPRTKPVTSRRAAAKGDAKKNVGAPAARKAKAERNAATAAKKSAARSEARTARGDRGAPAKRTASAKDAAPGNRSAPAKRSAPTERGAPAKRSAGTDRGAPAKRSAPADRGGAAKRSAPAKRAAPGSTGRTSAPRRGGEESRGRGRS